MEIKNKKEKKKWPEVLTKCKRFLPAVCMMLTVVITLGYFRISSNAEDGDTSSAQATITLDGNTGNADDVEVYTVNAGETFTMPDCSFYRDDWSYESQDPYRYSSGSYQFNAWATACYLSDASGWRSGSSYGSMYAWPYMGPAGASFTVEGGQTYTFYAEWQDVNGDYGGTVSVTYDANGGSGTMEKQTVTDDFPASIDLDACTFSKKGYVFHGWTTKKGSTKVEYEDEGSIEISDDITLYAVWRKEQAIFDTTNVINDDNMFTGDTKIVGGSGSTYDSNLVDSRAAHIDGGSEDKGYFTAK